MRKKNVHKPNNVSVLGFILSNVKYVDAYIFPFNHTHDYFWHLADFLQSTFVDTVKYVDAYIFPVNHTHTHICTSGLLTECFSCNVED